MHLSHCGRFFVPNSRRLACLFLAAVPLACAQQSAGPSGIQKINHVVFIIKKNRTYDNMFGAFNATYGTKTCKLSTGETVPMGRAADRYPHDIDHGWAAAILAMNNGMMNQFDLINLGSLNAGDGDGDLFACRQFLAAVLPNYLSYARHFALGAKMFSSLHGPSFPNHLYTLAADSFG